MDLTDYSLAVETPDPNRLIFFDSSTKHAHGQPCPSNEPIMFEQLQPKCPRPQDSRYFQCAGRMLSARPDEAERETMAQERMSNPVRSNSRADKSTKVSTKESESRISGGRSEEDRLKSMLALCEAKLEEKEAIIKGLWQKVVDTEEENLVLQMKLEQIKAKKVQDKREKRENEKRKTLQQRSSHKKRHETLSQFGTKKPPKPR